MFVDQLMNCPNALSYDGDDYDCDGDGTDWLKAVLCAVRQWLRFQLHREAGAVKKKTFKANLDFEKLDLELQNFIFWAKLLVEPGRVGE